MGLENPLHILIIMVVILMLFGAKRLPEMGRGLGRGLHEFRMSVTGQTTDTVTAGDTSAGDAVGHDE